MGKRGLLIAVVALATSACASGETNISPTPSATAQPEPTAATAEQETVTTASTETGVTAAPEELIATPAQQEGPYYPTQKLDDRDNDLVAIAGGSGTPGGTVLTLDGVLLTTEGQSIAGAVIEIWQTDANGIYLHPGDPRTDDRDPNFQFYGESVTDEAGGWFFRTIDPGHYEPRPRHIHVKVRLDGQELLTTQIYFAGDERLAEESIDDALIAVSTGQDGDGISVTYQLVVDL